MTNIERIKEFARSEEGAVTVDWVVLTAAICFVSVGIIAGIQSAVTDTATGIGAYALDEGTCALAATSC